MKRALVLSILATSPLAAQAPVKVDPSWLKVDSGPRVEFSLVAGLTSANGGMNFNGASGGGLTLTVPAHWTVILHFRNSDQVLPHSAMVIAAVTPVPVSGAKPAFEHAVTRQAEQGLPPEGHEDVQFVADKPGSYLLYCAVPGHGAAGMWIHLEVSATATKPELVATAAKGP